MKLKVHKLEVRTGESDDEKFGVEFTTGGDKYENSLIYIRNAEGVIVAKMGLRNALAANLFEFILSGVEATKTKHAYEIEDVS